MSTPRWPRLELVRDTPDDEDESEPTTAELTLVAADPVPADDTRLPVETGDSETALEGPVLAPAGKPQPQIRILPGWLRTPADFAAAATHSGRRTVVLAAHHGIRLPVYYAQVAKRSPVGVGRLTRAAWRWATDAETTAFMNVLSDERSSHYVNLADKRSHTRQWRTAALLTALGGLYGGVWWMHNNLQPWVLWAAVAAFLFTLGILGRPVGKPIITRTGVDIAPPVNENSVATALAALGIAPLTAAIKNDPINGIRFVPPGPHLDGTGIRIELDLPVGVTASDVVDRREKLASGLRRPLSSVWPTGDPDVHEARLSLWVADKPLAKQKAVPWPLLKKGAVDLFDPFPIGVDPRGRPITITIMFALMIIGAMPRMGKSFLMRLILLACALDVRVQMFIYDFKGGADFEPLEPVAHRLRIQETPENILSLLADTRYLQDDMARRYTAVRKLAKTQRDLCPEAKITTQLASRRDLQLHPVVLAIDECQRAFEHPEHGKELEARVTDLSKRGPAVGIIVILATQRPDAKSLPTGISSNAALRYCLKVAGQVENDMVLGTSMYKAGVRATMFGRKEYGVGYLAGEGDDPVICRAAYIDGPAAETVANRARQMRITAGRLTGEAAGDEAPEVEAQPSMLANLADVWPDPAKRETYENLAGLLTERLPDTYPNCTAEAVSAQCRAAGLEAVQVKRVIDGRQVNRYGVIRDDLIRYLDQTGPQ